MNNKNNKQITKNNPRIYKKNCKKYKSAIGKDVSQKETN